MNRGVTLAIRAGRGGRGGGCRERPGNEQYGPRRQRFVSAADTVLEGVIPP